MTESARTPEFEAYAEARKALKYGLHDAAHSVYRLMMSEAWRDYVTPDGQHVYHDRFEDFVVAEPLEGLGTDMETVRRLFRDFPKYLSDLLEITKRGPGRPKSETGHIVTNNDRPEGNTAAKALRRLRDQRPDLHDKVIAEELSAHAAMVEAGFRPPTCTIRVDDPQRAAATIRRRFNQEDLDRLVSHLKDS